MRQDKQPLLNYDRLPVLDGLRGIAVLLVLWYHIWEISWLPAPWPALQFVPETGFLGVDLFFFISGFVITYPFVRAAFEKTAPPTWAHFASRRFLKIVPSYALSIAVALALGYAHFASSGEALRALATHALFIHTWWSDTYGSINGVLWTLAVEVQFYAVFPALWWAFARQPWATALSMAALSLAYRNVALACCLQNTALMRIDNLPGYLDVFAAGMIGAHLFVRLRERHDRRRRLLATAAAGAGVLWLVALMRDLWATRLVDQWSTLWQVENRTWVAAALLAVAMPSLLALPAWRRAIGNRGLLFFGAISYNLYLYHQLLARELLAWRFPPYRGVHPHRDPHWQLLYTLAAFALSVLVAGLVTAAVERPLLRLRWRPLARIAAKRALSRM